LRYNCPAKRNEQKMTGKRGTAVTRLLLTHS
jgi:hypothetical protein